MAKKEISMKKIKQLLEKFGTYILFALIVIPWVLYWVYKKSNVKERITFKQKAKVTKVKTKRLKNKEEVQSLSQAVESAKSIIKNF